MSSKKGIKPLEQRRGVSLSGGETSPTHSMMILPNKVSHTDINWTRGAQSTSDNSPMALPEHPGDQTNTHDLERLTGRTLSYLSFSTTWGNTRLE